MELTLLVPVVVLSLGVMVSSGRVWLARSAVEQAAGAAARAASVERTQASARTAAERTVTTSLEGTRCIDVKIDVDTSGFALPPGVSAVVSVTVRCQVPLADVAVPGLPDSLTAESRGQAVLDTYRGRS